MLVLIRGAGDIATGIAMRLWRAGVQVVMTDLPQPTAIRRTVCFSQAIVLGEIAHRNVESWLANQANPEDPLYDTAQHQASMRPCNSLSIAEASGIPRETVRRKVVALIERGAIYKDAQGYLYLAPNVGDHYEDMTAELVESLLETARSLEALLAKRPVPIGPLRLD